MEKKKIVVFSGAGLDAESGVETFRGLKNSMWNNHKIDDVATPAGWRKNRAGVLEFYNERRRQMLDVEPNDAHKLIASLEVDYDVINLTQNVSDLLERAGSTNIIHLHGELTKARGCMYDNKVSPIDNVIDIGYKDINIGDKCPLSGSQLRPNIVWFGEMPFGVDIGYKAISEADYLLVIGTSLNIIYTLDMLAEVDAKCKVVYIDPEPSLILNKYINNPVLYIKETSIDGMTNFINKLKNEEI